MLFERLPLRVGGIQRRLAEPRAIGGEDTKIEAPPTLGRAVDFNRRPTLDEWRMVAEALQLRVAKAEVRPHDGTCIVNRR